MWDWSDVVSWHQFQLLFRDEKGKLTVFDATSCNQNEISEITIITFYVEENEEHEDQTNANLLFRVTAYHDTN